MPIADWNGVQRRLLPHRDQAVRAASLILGERQLAEDAVSEALIRAAFALPGLREPDALVTWFRRIVVREALRMARRRGREVPDADPDLPGWDPPPTEGVEAREEATAARRAVASLSPALQAAVALHHGLGLGVAETASILEIPPGTVKSRCAAARAILRTRLDRSLPEVLTMVEQAVRLANGRQIEEGNRLWSASGGPAPRPASEDEVRALFPETRWPSGPEVGLAFASGQIVCGGGLRMGWAFYGGEAVVLMISLSQVPPGWHHTIHDDTGRAARVETEVAGTPAVWVAREDAVHYVLFQRGDLDVCLGGNIEPNRLRTLAEEIVVGGPA